ncbi:AlbA family DNA-binding domain-containing protein [Nonomuraea ferruginea]
MNMNPSYYGIRPAYSDKNLFDLEVAFNIAKDISLDDLATAVRQLLADLGPTTPKTETIFGIPMCAEILIKDPPRLPWEDSVFTNIYFAQSGEIFFGISTSSFSRETVRRQHPRLSSLLRKHGFQLIDLTGVEDERSITNPDTLVKEWEISARVIDTRLTVLELTERRKALALASLFPRHRLSDPFIILQMIKMGGAENLIGEAESAILEVKSSPYEMKQDKQWQCELAEDVARFANSENGGLLILGIQTKKVDGQDRLEKIVPIPRDASRCVRYHQILDSRIHPPISDIDIGAIDHDRGEIAFILVPPQPETAKPFLVQGAYLDGRFQKGVISIVRRREEHSIPITAREIHAMLAAGRALLQRGDSSPPVRSD